MENSFLAEVDALGCTRVSVAARTEQMENWPRVYQWIYNRILELRRTPNGSGPELIELERVVKVAKEKYLQSIKSRT